MRSWPVALLLLFLATACARGGELPRQVNSSPAVLPSLSPAVTVLVATPTPGPDYNATRAAIEIRAAEDQAAGDQAYRLAGEAELTRQWTLATVEAGEAAIEATRAAELHEVVMVGTQQALELASANDQATATRQAALAMTSQADQDQERAHAAAIRAKERDAELHRATVQQWTRPLSAAVLPLMLFGLVVTAVLLMIRAALARNLADDILDLVERVTGNFAPIIDGTAVPVQPRRSPSTDLAEIKGLSQVDQDMLDLLHYARRAGSLAYNKLRAAGYSGGGPRWQRLLEKLAHDPRAPGGVGWVILDGSGGSKRYILRAGVNINDIRQAYGAFSVSPTPVRVHP